MNEPSNLRRITIAAMLVAAAGILLIFGSAPDLFPTVPPGPIILAIAATAVAFAPGRWTPVVGVAVPVFIIIGGVVSGGLVDNLGENAGVVTATAVQLVALVTAIVAGTLVTLGRVRTRVAL